MGYLFARATHYSLPTTHVLSPLCFHILTNCFSRNAFVFTTIRIAPGCGVLLMASFNLGRLSRLCLGPASARSCSRSFSALRRGLESRRCARTRGGGDDTRNIRR